MGGCQEMETSRHIGNKGDLLCFPDVIRPLWKQLLESLPSRADLSKVRADV